jgi:hypothetical protein
MVNSLKDAFERARRKLLEGADAKDTVAPSVSVQLNQAKLTSPLQTDSFGALQKSGPNQVLRVGVQNEVALDVANRRSIPVPVVRFPQSERVAPNVPSASSPAATVAISSQAVCSVGLRDTESAQLLPTFETAGRVSQIHVGIPDDEREVVLGLDFGTSCVKVVIGDSALGKAFAVPFCNADGITKFLLPSRLCQTGRVFSLTSGTHTYRDLKLSLLASPEDSTLQQRVVAFLSLIIRRARGWLLSEHGATYQRTAIAWKLAVGLPTAQHHQSPLSELFERLSHAAWLAAGAPGDITDTAIQALLKIQSIGDEAATGVEVTVVPEIAAQIYGFVASNSFDKQAPNIYLMADVGSGTVDSSLFRVKQGKGGRWDFEFYTSVVEPNGVSNLHRHRVNWWTDTLMAASAPSHLLADLEATKLITDQQFSTPEKYTDYFSGVEVKLRDPKKSPDAEFFNLRVLAQVQGKTLWRTWKDNLLPQSSLVNIPFFMCGGGVRMSYYQQLEPQLASMPGFSWLKAECWVMGVPDDLIAEGVAQTEYDRLSVAYGLSRLEVGKVIKALPHPKLSIPAVNIWRDNYVDKDQC